MPTLLAPQPSARPIARAIASGLALLMLTGCAAASNAAPTTSSSPRPATAQGDAPSSGATFTSTLYGYTLRPPVGWTIHPASLGWSSGRNDFRDPAVSDVLQSTSRAEVRIAVTRLPAGTSGTAWEKRFVADHANAQMRHCYPDPPSWTPAQIGGLAGGVLGGQEWCGFTAGVVVVGDRAVVIEGVVDPEHLTADVFDRAVLDQVFSSIDLSHLAA